MKFKDKYGNVFDSVEVFHRAFCFGVNRKGDPLDCADFRKMGSAEIARLMGYEVVEDEPL